MKKLLCSLLSVSMIVAAVPVGAATSESKSPAAASTTSLQTAIQQTATRVALAPAPAVRTQSGAFPRSMPRRPSDQIRRQGGGHVGMVVGLVSALAGVAGTVYMVKAMKKTTDQAKQQ